MSTAPRSDGAREGGAGSSSVAQASERKPTPPWGKLRRAGRATPGLAVIAGCFLAGEFAKLRFGLILPGSVLGLFLLLALLGARLVRIEWVEEGSRLLLTWLPLFFVPIYVYAADDRALWRVWGSVIAGTLALTVTLLWIFVGRFAQRVLARPGGKEAP